MALVCRGCYRELLEEEMPDDPRAKLRCPKRKSGKFIAMADPPAEPKVAYALNPNDERLLRRFRIKCEP